MIKNYVTQLKSEFRNYSGADCMKDLMAGLTVAAVALPLALAFGVSSGSTAAAGLVTAIIAGLVIGTLSGGYYQISGPTGAMAAILISRSCYNRLYLRNRRHHRAGTDRQLLWCHLRGLQRHFKTVKL